MALIPLVHNTTTGKRQGLLSGGFKDVDATATASQINFNPPSGVTLESGSIVDVFVDGRLQRPTTYTVNVGSNRVEISGGVALDVWVRVRVHNV